MPLPSPPLEPHAALSFEDTQIAFASKDRAYVRKAYLLFASFNLPWLVRVGSLMTLWLLRAHIPLIKWAVKKTVFDHFCAGESISECASAVEELNRSGVKSILDYSVEGEKSEAGFEATAKETLATIDWGLRHSAIAFSVFKTTGVARFGLMEKLQSAAPLTDLEKAEWERAKDRVGRICQRAADVNGRVLIDGEETCIQKVIDALAEEMMARHNRGRVVVYTTYQMYRTASLGNLKVGLSTAQSGGYQLGAKLVRGAYMETERKRARELGYPDPIQPDKAATDADYDAAILFCLDHLDQVALCAGTHNEESCQLLAQELERRGIHPANQRVFFSQLYGMSDNISFNLAKAGFCVAKYLPYGPVRSVMPYLIRRAQENSAIAGQGGREFRLLQRELLRRKRSKSLP